MAFFKDIADRCMHKINKNLTQFPEEDDSDKQKSVHWPLKYAGVSKLYAGCTFNTYKGNAKLVTDLIEIAKTDNSLILRGNTGCGKTHLAVAMIENKNYHDVRFITVPDLLLKIRSSFNNPSGVNEDEIIREYSEIPILVLDDLGAEKTSEFAITTLYIILDRRIRDCRKTIITTNLSKEEIEATFGARIASRLAGMENIKINMPDNRKKRS